MHILKDQVNRLISEAEKKWLNLLTLRVTEAFSNVFLPSHDASHHRRVWNYAKSILLEAGKFNPYIDITFVEGLLISVYFHDQGMVATREKEHGKMGRQLCKAYFYDNNLEKPENFNQILDAIEMHDIKDKIFVDEIPPDNKPELLTLLRISDDMDALGIIGIYRYAEIYLHRGIEIRSIGKRIMDNVTIRFKNLSQICSRFPVLMNSSEKRYLQIISFFEEYNRQLLYSSDPENDLTGPLGIINIIKIFSVEGTILPTDFSSAIKNYKVSDDVLNYFNELNHELK